MGGDALLVGGVAGSGKSTVGASLARRLGARFVEGDDLHSPESVAKMAAGEALDDSDRWPWLERIAGSLNDARRGGVPVVVACSALRRAYRDFLRRECPGLRMAYLGTDAGVLRRRLEARRNHFMGPRMLDSQLAIEERPADSEGVIVVDGERPIDDLVDAILSAL